jgi:hypothetical protein
MRIVDPSPTVDEGDIISRGSVDLYSEPNCMSLGGKTRQYCGAVVESDGMCLALLLLARGCSRRVAPRHAFERSQGSDS